MSGTMQRLLLSIRRGDSRTGALLKRALKAALGWSCPPIGPLHRALYWERTVRRIAWDRLTKGLYYEPLFKSQCASVGSGFRLLNGGGDGIPVIDGDLRIHLGADVRMMDRITLTGMKYFDEPRLFVGDRTFLGPNMLISAAREIRIGSDCLISAAIITDNPNHPMMDAVKRVRGESFAAADVKPVVVGDFAWLATGCHVFAGCRIGDGVVVLPFSQLRGLEAPPFTLVGGNPARILAKFPLTSSLRAFVGDERFEAYQEAHRALKIERA